MKGRRNHKVLGEEGQFFMQSKESLSDSAMKPKGNKY